MLIKLLSDVDKKHLVQLAKLLALSDKPLLWDGKTSDEFTSSTDLDAMSIREGEQERELIADMEVSAGITGWQTFGFSSSSEVHDRLVEVLKSYPVIKVEKPEIRAQAASTVLMELLKGKVFELPATPKETLKKTS